MKLIDLHTHSLCSDGAQTPADVVRTAKAAGLAAIALAMATGTASLISAVLILAALAAPWLYGRSRAGAL